jgi:alpha-beta hydrolase superfamily lysophospholipase
MSLADYSSLDRPELLRILFYPRKDFTPPPPNSTDHLIGVEGDISIACRFYVHNQKSPSILYFHGNGEVVSDHDYFAPLYNQLGINLFVADYRGYGSSGGTPNFTNLFADAHSIFKGFEEVLREGNYSDKVFVMGRSLGSISAVEMASHYGRQIKGLIVESGFGSMGRMMTRLGFSMESPGITATEFPNLAKIRGITLPTLIIHAQFDSIAPLAGAKELFQNAAAERKRMVIIPGADHNDLMLVGMEPYFESIRDFVFG